MKITDRKHIKGLIEDALGLITSEIENKRYEPSERGAGAAPTDDAMECAYDHLCGLITELGRGYGAVDMDKVNSKLTIDEIKETITLENAWKACDIDELEEIDSFSDDYGESKYRYDTTIYKHKPSGEFISIEIQKTADGKVHLSLGEIVTVEKKEKVTYEWT